MRAERRFCRQVLSLVDAKLVFDIGANVGGKTTQYSSLVDKVVSVEPSPAAVDILKQRFARYANVVVLGKGVGAEEGTARFYLFGEADCYNTFSPKWAETLATSELCGRPHGAARETLDVPVTTLDQLVKEYGLPSYIKVDVEGYELQVIRGLSKPVPMLSFECNLPEFLGETVECVSLLSGLAPSALFNYCLEEPPVRFASERWLERNQLLDVLTTGNVRFAEIYCKSI
jgi:FkbM family methyltransferase